MNGVSESVSGSVKIDTTDILAYSITPYRLMVVLSVGGREWFKRRFCRGGGGGAVGACRNCGACGDDG